MQKVMVLATGGTIAGAGESSTGGTYKSAQVGISDLMQSLKIPEGVCVESQQVSNVGSQDISASIWFELLEQIHTLAAREDIKGFVITHGTDSMEESAYFLNLTVQTYKPVVLVGAMRNGSSMGADGPLNIYNALAIAAHPESAGKGVLVAMDDTIHAAREITKSNTSSLHTFISPNCGPIGSVYYAKVHFYMQPLRKHTLQSQLALTSLQPLPPVALIYTHVDCGVSSLKAAIDQGVMGVVVAGMGNGNPSSAMLEAMAEAVKQGIVVVRASRTGSGVVELGEVDDLAYGFVTPDNLNAQKARVLLQLALLKTHQTTQIQEFFNTH